jgi:hypothetical protein
VALLANREKSAGGNPSQAYSRAFGVPIFAEAFSARCLPAAARGFTNPASAMASGPSSHLVHLLATSKATQRLCCGGEFSAPLAFGYANMRAGLLFNK